MYSFRDITDHTDITNSLPSEAVSINGQYIENVLSGYRTLYTKGRESLGVEITANSVGIADGEKYKYKRYPARTITVGFQLIANTPHEFREKFTNLNNLLSLDEADFIFADETDMFFSGIPIMNASVEAGQNSVKGEWQIYCAYPYKRSVEPVTLTMEDATVSGNTATFVINYEGTRPSKPVLRARFAGAKAGGESTEDGDCGFVAFVDGYGNIIQLGNPTILDLDEYASTATLVNREFTSLSGWQTSGGHTWNGSVTGTMTTGTIADAQWARGKGILETFAKPNYGSGSGMHGSILWKRTNGAIDWTLNAVHRLCVNGFNETGIFECSVRNSTTNKIVAGFVIEKSGNGVEGWARYIIDDKEVGSEYIDLSYYNTHFGFCKRTDVYTTETYEDYIEGEVTRTVVKDKNGNSIESYTQSPARWETRTRQVFQGYNYTQSNLNSSIVKRGSQVSFKLGNLPQRSFTAPEIEQTIAHDATCYMGTSGTPMHTNAIHSLLFRKEASAVFADQPNVFTAGDVVEADCNEATVYLYRSGSMGGALSPAYGALGNNWENFALTAGTNIIQATWSDWVDPEYIPQIEIEYNEVDI